MIDKDTLERMHTTLRTQMLPNVGIPTNKLNPSSGADISGVAKTLEYTDKWVPLKYAKEGTFIQTRLRETGSKYPVPIFYVGKLATAVSGRIHDSATIEEVVNLLCLHTFKWRQFSVENLVLEGAVEVTPEMKASVVPYLQDEPVQDLKFGFGGQHADKY